MSIFTDLSSFLFFNLFFFFPTEYLREEHMACWSDLSQDILSVIAGLLTKNSDYIRFRSVCVWWRRAADPVPRHLPVQPPLLFLPENQGLYSPSTNTTQWIHLPEAFQKRCCGSSHGWLAFVDRDPYVFLLNPITGSRIDLPPIIFEPVGRYIFRPAFCIASRKGKPQFYIQKVVLSANPNSGARWTAVAILDASPQAQTHHVAFWRPGDEKWTLIDRSVCIYDVAFCNGKFYFFDGGGFLLEHDVDSAKTIVHYCLVPCPFTGQNYLVESGGKLLLVIQHQYLETRDFNVLRFNLEGEPKFILVENLGDRVIFLGENHSFSFSSTEFIGCRKNCIYFTDDDYLDMKEDFPNRKRDLGIFNVDEDRRITKRLPCCPIERLPTFPCHALLTRQPPIWITPSLC